MTKRSQIQAIGVPPPKTWQDYRDGCLMTFRGGYHDDVKLDAFQHGMNTVFNLLENELPNLLPAAAPEQADADVTEAEAGTHTPGPWFVVPKPWDDSGSLVTSQSPDPNTGETVCSTNEGMWHDHIPSDVAEWQANAQLIARAPDLLAENDRLRADLATVTEHRNELMNVGTALEADLKAEREAKDGALRALSVASDLANELYEAHEKLLDEYNSLLLTSGDTDDAMLSLSLKLKIEREDADGLADALRHKDAEWSPARMSPDRSICPYCLQLKTDGHADNCQRQMLLAVHDARRADGGEA